MNIKKPQKNLFLTLIMIILIYVLMATSVFGLPASECISSADCAYPEINYCVGTQVWEQYGFCNLTTNLCQDAYSYIEDCNNGNTPFCQGNESWYEYGICDQGICSTVTAFNENCQYEELFCSNDELRKEYGWCNEGIGSCDWTDDLIEDCVYDTDYCSIDNHDWLRDTGFCNSSTLSCEYTTETIMNCYYDYNTCISNEYWHRQRFCEIDTCVPNDVLLDTCTDNDADTVPDEIDNCVGTSNINQEDADADGVGDICDNCINAPNLDQIDIDEDGIGDACDNYLIVDDDSSAYIDANGIVDCDNLENSAYASIQQAVLAASEGMTVIVCPGTYYECPTIDKAVTVTGTDRGTTIIDGTGCVNDNFYIVGLSNSDQNADVTFENFTLVNNELSAITSYGVAAISASDYNPIIKMVNIENSNTYYGVQISNALFSSKIQIENNVIKNTCGGVYVGISNNISINDNVIESNGVRTECVDEFGYPLIADDLAGIYMTDSINAEIKNNIITQSYRGIYLLYSTDIRIQDSDLLNNTHEAIEFYSSSRNTVDGGEISGSNQEGSDSYAGGINAQFSSNLTINRVYMHDNKGGAIGLYDSSDDVTIENNNIVNNCGNIRQIQVSYSNNALIQNNNITDGTGDGIRIENGNGAQILNNNISGNNQNGIYISTVEAYSDHLISGNEINNNYNGVYIEGEDNVTIENNAINNNGDNGVHLYSSTIIVIENNTIEGNCEGVRLEYNSDANLTDNDILNNQYCPATGLYVDSSSHAELIDGNFINNGEYGILDNSGGTSVYWNIIDGARCENNNVNIYGAIYGIEKLCAINCVVTINDSIQFISDLDDDGISDVCDSDKDGDGYDNESDCDDSVSSCNTDCLSVSYADSDSDTFGDAEANHRTCDAPEGYVSDNADCDDSQVLYSDNDGDGFGAGEPAACGITNNTDCNDYVESGENVHAYQTYYFDSDKDGYGVVSPTVSRCSISTSRDEEDGTYVTNSQDCNDANVNIHPGVTDIKDNNIDENCDGSDAKTPVSSGGGAMCSPKWTDCTEWSECLSDGHKTRQCRDASNCLIGQVRQDTDICTYTGGETQSSENQTTEEVVNETQDDSQSDLQNDQDEQEGTEGSSNQTINQASGTNQTVPEDTSSSNQSNDLTGQVVGESKGAGFNWWIGAGVLALILALLIGGYFFFRGGGRNSRNNEIFQDGWMQK